MPQPVSPKRPLWVACQTLLQAQEQWREADAAEKAARARVAECEKAVRDLLVERNLWRVSHGGHVIAVDDSEIPCVSIEPCVDSWTFTEPVIEERIPDASLLEDCGTAPYSAAG